jgi:hypothetical protein
MGRIFAAELGAWWLALPACAALLSACSPSKGASGSAADASVEASDDASADASDGAADGPSDSAVGDVSSDTGEAGEPSDSEASADGDDDAESDGGDEDAPPLPPLAALLRFANWSPDSPAFDVCTALQGTTTFTGPLIASVLDSDGDDGGTVGESGSPGLAFPLVSSYFFLEPAVYDVRFVAAGSTTCDAPVIPDTTTPLLVRGEGISMALVGEAGSDAASGDELRVLTFADEITDEASGPLRLRFINAAPDLAVAQMGSGAFSMMSFIQIFPAVPFGEVAPVMEANGLPGVDPDGYCPVRNLVGTVLSVGIAGSMTDSLTTMSVYTVAGIPVTTVAIGGTASGVPLSLLECLDSAGTVPPLSACSVLQPFVQP